MRPAFTDPHELAQFAATIPEMAFSRPDQEFGPAWARVAAGDVAVVPERRVRVARRCKQVRVALVVGLGNEWVKSRAGRRHRIPLPTDPSPRAIHTVSSSPAST